MNKFFYELTKRNWGFPYHIILADLLATGILALYLFLWAGVPFGQLAGITWISVNIIGYIYETIQIKNNPAAKEEFWEDVIGNNVGIIFACVKFWAIIKVM